MTDKDWEERIRSGPKPSSVWRHYKGNLYVVVGTALLEFSKQPVVVYRGYDDIVSRIMWVRPLSEWTEMVLPTWSADKEPRFVEQ